MTFNNTYDEEDSFEAQYASPAPLAQSRVGDARGRKAKISPRRTELASEQNPEVLGEASSGGMQSLAHELAAALMPQPTPGSSILAEELGLEFDDGAEGMELDHAEVTGDNVLDEYESLIDNSHMQMQNGSAHGTPHHSTFVQTEQHPIDPFSKLSYDIESVETFLSHLRRLDGDHASNQEPPLEKAVSNLIRKVNETIQEREDQVRQLLELEREFRRISGEIDGGDVLGSLDELEVVVGLTEDRTTASTSHRHSRLPSLAEVEREDWSPTHSRQHSYNEDVPMSPVSPSMPTNGVVTPSGAIPHVTHFRTQTKSLALTLTSISEQTQVNAAATADAGRKIRALKHKLGDWQSEWDSAERSRERIAEWESSENSGTRVSGRNLAEAEVSAFATVLELAAVKTQTIMLSA